MPALTTEQQQLLKESGGAPVRLVDPSTLKQYVLLEATKYEQFESLLSDANPRDFYPLLERVMQDEGWDDPRMDEYNRYG
jgi:hypothetical protein